MKSGGRRSFVVWAALCGLAACAPAPAERPGPIELVQELYDEPVLWFASEAEWGRYFTEDLWRAMVEDASDPDLVGNVNFDYRFDSQDGTVSGLTFESLDRAPGLVAASLAVEGDPRTIVWTLCQRSSGGWRIADAQRTDGDAAWSLRGLLNLPEQPASC